MTLDPATPPLQLLDRIGPDAPPAPTLSTEEALAYCHGLATSHYENFSVLTSLVPTDLRDDFAAVYAFCRWADDLGDETGSDDAARAHSLTLLNWWRTSLQHCFDPAGPHPSHPVFVALRNTAQRHAAHGLTAKPFDDLISAFEQDQRITRYQTWDQVLDYCTRSADPVGRIVLMLGGYAPPDLNPDNAERYRLGDLTCSALQLINFWQDVRRDLLERDRIYLPLADTGLTAETLRDWLNRPNDPAARVPYIHALRPLVERTNAMFTEAQSLHKLLDNRIGPVVWLFGAGGRAIASAVERQGCTTLWHRPKLSKVEKALLVGRAWWMKKRG